MANENFKTINTRIALRTGDYAYWTTGAGKDIELYKGEVCVCTVAATDNQATTAPTVLFKVCDTTGKKFADLNWVSGLAADVYAWAKKANPDWADFPALPLTVVDDGTGKFVTDFTYNNNTLTITRSDVALADISDKEKIALATDLGTVTTLTTTAKTAVGAINEHDTEIGDLSQLNTTNKGSLVNAINEALQAVEVGGTGSVVTLVKEDKTTYDEYTLKQGGEAVGDKVIVGKNSLTMRAGNGLAATETTFSSNGTNAPVFEVSHADTSSVANVTAANRTYVKSLTFDDYGHVTAVSTGAETVVDTNTAHTHSVGDGLKKTGNGGIDGDVKYELNVAMKLEDGDIVIYDKSSDNEVARLDAAELLEDSYLNDVDIVGNELQFTWKMDDGTTKTDSVDLTHLVDVYKGTTGDYITVSVSDYNISATLNKVDTAIIENGAITYAKLDARLQAATDTAEALGHAISLGMDPTTEGPFIEFNDSVTIISGPNVYVGEEDENNRVVTKGDLDESTGGLGSLISEVYGSNSTTGTSRIDTLVSEVYGSNTTTGDSRIDTIEERVADMQGIEQELEVLTEEVFGSNSTTGTSRIDTLVSEVYGSNTTTGDSRIDTIEERVADIEGDIQGIDREIEVLTEEVFGSNNTTGTSRIDTLQEAVDTLNGAGTVEGSVAYQVAVLRNSLVAGSITVSKATSATSATKATQDGDGNVISSTYQKKTDNTLSTTDKTVVGAINHLHTVINEFITGDTSVQQAVEAESATEALKDADGNVISSTYVKKSDATGYNDILTKTAAKGLYATTEQGAKADSALQTITTTENGGLKVTNKNQIDIDDSIVFILDCNY